MTVLFDTHCHLDVAEFDADREHIIERCRQTGIDHILVPAVGEPGWGGLLSLCARHPGLYPALGLHPVYLEDHHPGDILALENRARQENIIAIGEIGLDFHVQDLDRARQQELFEAQLRIAQKLELPVILHVRKAHDQVLQTLKRIPVRGGIAHAFNGSLQQADMYHQLGFRLGFGGMLTYERSTRLRTLARELPLEFMVLETDAPDLTVARFQGHRNSPEYLVDCLDALAQVRGESRDYVAQQTTANAMQVLALPRAFRA